MLNTARIFAFMACVSACFYTATALQGCASFQSVTTSAVDCAGKTAQTAIANVVGTIELILVAASDSEWMTLLDKLAAQWGPEGVAYVTCAIDEIRQHYASQSVSPDAGTRPAAIISLKPGNPSVVLNRCDAWKSTKFGVPLKASASATGAGKR